MKNILVIAALAVATVVGAGSANAMGIPDLPAQPLVATQTPAVMGEADPAFGAPVAPVISAHVASQTIGQNYPAFIAPDQNIQYAQVGHIQTLGG
ncbi:MAG TPA: hypothetical protein VF286_09820 [Acidiphilium sp.]